MTPHIAETNPICFPIIFLWFPSDFLVINWNFQNPVFRPGFAQLPLATSLRSSRPAVFSGEHVGIPNYNSNPSKSLIENKLRTKTVSNMAPKYGKPFR